EAVPRGQPRFRRVQPAHPLPAGDARDHHAHRVPAPLPERLAPGGEAMIPIPGILVALVTFPGVIVHEAAHMLFCKLRGVAIFDVKFFRFGNPVGYVVHQEIEDFTSAFLVAVGPFIVNTTLCLVFCFPAILPLRIFGQNDPISWFLAWLAISIGMHAFPSTHDARCLWGHAKKRARTLQPLALLSFPLVVLIYAGNLLRVVWADYFYGFAVGFLLPVFLLNRWL